MIRRLTLHDRNGCMDLAARVGWPREPDTWEMLFELGPCFGVDGGEALSAMVAMPRFEGATFVAMMVVDPAEQAESAPIRWTV